MTDTLGNGPLSPEDKRGLEFRIQEYENEPVEGPEFGVDPDPASEKLMDAARRYRDAITAQPTNPKTVMGRLKVPNLSVVPFSGIIEEARAMEYGAFHSPRKDGSKGYGPYNWRESGVEFMAYIEAAVRHLASAADREDIDPESGEHLIMHLGLAKATIGILIDAIKHDTVIDDRPKTARGRTAQLLRDYRKQA